MKLPHGGNRKGQVREVNPEVNLEGNLAGKPVGNRGLEESLDMEDLDTEDRANGEVKEVFTG